MAKKSLTRLEEKQAAKKELGQAEWELKQTDKTGGWKFVQQTEDAKVKAKNQKKADVLTDWESKKQRRFSYLRKMAELVQKGVEEIEWDAGWEAAAIPTHGERIRIYGRGFETKEGVVLVAKSPDGRVFIKAWGVCFDPERDMRNMRELVNHAENTLDSEKGLLLTGKDAATGLKKTKSGIIVP